METITGTVEGRWWGCCRTYRKRSSCTSSAITTTITGRKRTIRHIREHTLLKNWIEMKSWITILLFWNRVTSAYKEV
jgi:hypothetical protein